MFWFGSTEEEKKREGDVYVCDNALGKDEKEDEDGRERERERK